MSLIPEKGYCDYCGIPLDVEDGYVVFDEGYVYRFCDEHGIEDKNE